MNRGDNPSTATRVKGTVKEKATTPRRPHHIPVEVLGDITGRERVVALLL
jgi:hypothetical protein